MYGGLFMGVEAGVMTQWANLGIRQALERQLLHVLLPPAIIP